MSIPLLAATDPVAVGVTVVATLVVVALVAAVASLLGAARDLRRGADELRQETVELLDEISATVRQAGLEVERVERMVGSAEAISGVVGSASRLVGGAMASPFIKLVALGSGVARGLRLVRGGPAAEAAPPGRDGGRRRHRARGQAGRGSPARGRAWPSVLSLGPSRAGHPPARRRAKRRGAEAGGPMFKRVTWLGAGLVTGFAASKWVERKARRRLARYLPARQLPLKAGVEMAGKARELAVSTMADLRSAIDEGRTTMVAREAELRRQWDLGEAGRPGDGGKTDVVRARARGSR